VIEQTPKSIEQKYQREALQHRDKIIDAGWPLEKANRLARAKFYHAVFPDEIDPTRPDPDSCGP
jgi:hypothetical protein